MLDTEPRVLQARAATTAHHLAGLVARTATGDRAAFRCLYAFLAMSVWRVAALGLPQPGDASAVTRSTFIELWHLAGRHSSDDPHRDLRARLAAITAVRVNDRTRILNHGGVGVVDYDACVRRELRDLLGPGRALIRTGSRTFTDIDDLDGALATICATARWPADPHSGPLSGMDWQLTG